MKVLRHKLFFIGYLSLIIAGIFTWYFQKNVTTSKAAVDTVTITLSPKTGTFSATAQQDIDLLVQTTDASKKISGIDLTLTAGGSVRFTNITDPTAFPATSAGLFNQVSRSVTDQKIRISYVSIKPDVELPAVVKIRVSVQGTGVGVGKITVDQIQTQIVGNVIEKEYGINSADEGIYTFGQTTGNSVSARIDPPSFQLPLVANAGYGVAIAMTDVPPGKKISAYQFVIQYDPSLIEITSIDPPYDAATGADSDKFTMLKKNIDINAGTIELAYIVMRPASELPVSPRQVIQIKGKKLGSGTLTIISQQVTGDIPESEYVVNVSNGTYKVIDFVPSPSVPTPTSGNVNLNLKLKFQGISRKPASASATMKVKVTLDGKRLNDATSQVVDFTADLTGVWSGIASFNAILGDGYKVYIKGLHHLQKRICDMQPTETASGTYRCGDTGKIVIATGNNNLDFSQIIQLSGDIPDQDGVVDAYDMSFIRLNLGAIDPRIIGIGDLNHDGILDTQDYSLLVASLNVKYDEL